MPKTLLLADDSITIRKVVGIIFASEDYSVTTVDNGEDALAKIREQRPDLVLADVVMPRKNGYELCEAVKNDSDLRDLPVLLLAGTFEAFDEARAKAVRADGWIQKPFDSATLLGKVREVVEGIAPPPVPSLPYVTAAQPRPAAAPTIAPPPPGAPLPAGARPLPGAAPGPFAAPPSPFAAPPQPFAPRPPMPPPPPVPPAPPFAARPSVVPVPPPPPPAPFAVRPPVPPAPPPPPTFRAPPPPPAPFEARSPTFAAPQPPRAAFDAPTFAAPPPPPPVNVVVPLPPPPPPAPEPQVAPLATLEELDFSGAAFDEPLATMPAPPPATPPPAPAIPTLKVAPPVEPDAELDFDIDEAAAPIDLADLAAEEITEEEALATGEAHAEVAPLPTLDLSREEPSPLDLSSPWDEPLPPRAPAVPASIPVTPVVPLSDDSFADLFADESRTPPALELQPEPETQLAELPDLVQPTAPVEMRLDADPLSFRPAVEAPAFEEEETGLRPFGFDAEPEPAFTAMPAFEAEPPPSQSERADEPAELAPPPIAVDADEAVLREVLSRASRETIERVVWEVVPQLAEQIIREHLEQLMKDRKNS